MKKVFLMAALACLALFSSCEKQGVDHTGDLTGNLYGVWALQTKTVTVQDSNGETTTPVDYSGVHFYLAMGEFPFPHAITKKGSFTDLDLDDVDVDAVTFSFNADEKKITFNKKLWLSDEMLTYNMILNGTFDVLELKEKSLVISQTSTLLSETTTTTYSFQKME
ncbi:MAG: hypothetical protein K5910_08645 [Bacteroidales bacterium]|nr:hypothetical protein [Bacteroidales bacterium]